MKLVVLDIQGFQIGDEFVAKEISMYNGSQSQHYIFKYQHRPFSSLSAADKRGVRYMEKHHHGLPYSCGDVSYEDLPEILLKYLREYDKIYVCGHQKYNFLKNEFNQLDIINIENLVVKPPKIQRNRPLCMSHNKNWGVGSLNNSILLYNWLLSFLPQ